MLRYLQASDAVSQNQGRAQKGGGRCDRPGVSRAGGVSGIFLPPGIRLRCRAQSGTPLLGICPSLWSEASATIGQSPDPIITRILSTLLTCDVGALFAQPQGVLCGDRLWPCGPVETRQADNVCVIRTESGGFPSLNQ